MIEVTSSSPGLRLNGGRTLTHTRTLPDRGLGRHVILDLRDCNPGLLDDPQYIRSLLLDVAHDISATVIDETIHQFSPQGVSGVIAIAESHIAIHTWPEHAYAAVDIFTCGETMDARSAVETLVERLECGDHSVVELARGVLPTFGEALVSH